MFDYLPEDALVIVDESHQSVPQVRGMYAGDRSRKEVLVAYGFRLPSALDNRPLTFAEWEERVNQVVFVSATPGPYEMAKAGGVVVEQVIRPTGLMDPPIEVRPVRGQVDDLLKEIRDRAARKERVLVTTLTKRMAEDLTQYYQELGVRVRYLHSDIDTLERIEILRELRRGSFDVLVGINLLREGLDLPEVSLVAILDADKEGFLRSAGSLIQTSGRAARNVNGRVIMYADKMTASMKSAIAETERRQRAGRRPTTSSTASRRNRWCGRIEDVMSSVYERDYSTAPATREPRDTFHTQAELDAEIARLEAEMKSAAANLDFERAATLRDTAKSLRSRELGLDEPAGRTVTRGEPSSRHGSKTARAARGPGRARSTCRSPRFARSSRGRFYFHDVVEQFDEIGIGSLTVVLLTGFFTGAVLALQSGITLDQFGARSVVGRLVGASMVKELGPVLTALMVTGRVGSGIAAELGSMVVTDQINALRALGTDPVRKLVVPRVLAGIFMAPVLTVISDTVGIFGGWIIAVYQLRVASTVYWTSITEALYLQDAWMGIIKPFFLGYAIVTIGCHVGLRTSGGTQGVGRATTNAVVAASVAVIAVDFFVTRLLFTLLY